jgi:hypothetical protein
MIFHPNRVFLKPLESAVLVIRQGNYSMIFYIAFVFLLLKFWKRSEYDCSTMKCPFFLQFYHVIMTMFFSGRNDEKVACQKILDKIGLQGYQVKPLYWPNSSACTKYWHVSPLHNFHAHKKRKGISLGGYSLLREGATYIIIYSLRPEIQSILVCPKSNCSKFDQVYRKE